MFVLLFVLLGIAMISAGLKHKKMAISFFALALILGCYMLFHLATTPLKIQL